MLAVHAHAQIAPARAHTPYTRMYPAATCCFGNRVEMRRERLEDKNGSVARGAKILVVRTCKDEEGMNGGMSRAPEGGKKGDK